MPAPILHGVNLLELGTVTVTGEAIGKPKARLFDRDIGLLYQDVATTGTREIPRVNVPGNTQSLDAWILAAGHNLAGVTVSLDSSADGVAWTARDSVVPASSAVLRRTISPVLADWWRLTATGAATPPALAELFLTQALALPRAPSEGRLQEGERGNVSRRESRGGHVWNASRGEARWEAEYGIRDLTIAERDALRTFFRTTIKSGALFFYLVDADGITRYVEWLGELVFTAVPVNRFDVTLPFREVLGLA